MNRADVHLGDRVRIIERNDPYFGMRGIVIACVPWVLGQRITVDFGGEESTYYSHQVKVAVKGPKV